MAYTLPGLAVYTETETGFQKVKLKTSVKNKANYAHAADNGWWPVAALLRPDSESQ